MDENSVAYSPLERVRPDFLSYETTSQFSTASYLLPKFTPESDGSVLDRSAAGAITPRTLTHGTKASDFSDVSEYLRSAYHKHQTSRTDLIAALVDLNDPILTALANRCLHTNLPTHNRHRGDYHTSNPRDDNHNHGDNNHGGNNHGDSRCRDGDDLRNYSSVDPAAMDKDTPRHRRRAVTPLIHLSSEESLQQRALERRIENQQRVLENEQRVMPKKALVSESNSLEKRPLGDRDKRVSDKRVLGLERGLGERVHGDHKMGRKAGDLGKRASREVNDYPAENEYPDDDDDEATPVAHRPTRRELSGRPYDAEPVLPCRSAPCRSTAEKDHRSDGAENANSLPTRVVTDSAISPRRVGTAPPQPISPCIRGRFRPRSETPPAHTRSPIHAGRMLDLEGPSVVNQVAERMGLGSFSSPPPPPRRTAANHGLQSNHGVQASTTSKGIGLHRFSSETS
ncbi:hypothetical protein GNI_070370, partial [Gregarina niphandrodes]